MVYLDNAATTKPCEQAISAVVFNMEEEFGNPSSLHSLGIKAEKALTEARKAIAAALICDPQCVIFTSGATECNNAVIFGAAKKLGKRKKKIVISAGEHPSVSEPVKHLETNYGFSVTRVSLSRTGETDPDLFISEIDDDTCLVSCMLVNNETGAIAPVKKIFSYVKKNFPECVTHCDAAQGFMKIPIKSAELYADAITVSGHKVHAAKGVGAMYLRKGTGLSPFSFGGKQEFGMRSGTESVPLIAGFGAAVRRFLPSMNTAYENAEAINRYLLKKLSKLDFITVNSGENAIPFIVSFSVRGIPSEVALHFLESKGIYLSSGSACSKGARSSVLKSMGLSNDIADTSLRASFCRATSMGEIDALVSALYEGYESLAKI